MQSIQQQFALGKMLCSSQTKRAPRLVVTCDGKKDTISANEQNHVVQADHYTDTALGVRSDPVVHCLVPILAGQYLASFRSNTMEKLGDNKRQQQQQQQ